MCDETKTCKKNVCQQKTCCKNASRGLYTNGMDNQSINYVQDVTDDSERQ